MKRPVGISVLIAMFAVVLIATGISTRTLHVDAMAIDSGVSVTAVVEGAAPTLSATIIKPQASQYFTTSPLVVSGSCGPLLMVKLLNNEELVGTDVCTEDGTFTINIQLKAGSNILKVLNYNALNQAGPASEQVEVFLDDSPSATSSADAIISGGSSRQNTNQGFFEDTPAEPLAYWAGIGDPEASPIKLTSAASVAVMTTTLLIDASFFELRLTQSFLLSSRRLLGYGKGGLFSIFFGG